MNLINIYIQEVTRRLPKKSRDDIALELRSTIGDMLPENYSEDDIKDVLEKLGNPAALASDYRDQPMHLIGPRYYDVYISLLKMILPIAIVITLILLFVEHFIGFNGEESIMNVVLTIAGDGILSSIEVGVQVFFWITLVFAIIERTDKAKDQYPLSASLQKWNPNDLKTIPYIPRKKTITQLEVFGYLLWTAIWATLYFYANHLIGIYESGSNGLTLVISALNQDVLLRSWPIVIVVIASEVWFSIYKLLKGQWTNKMVIFNTALELFTTVVFIVILSDANLMNEEFLLYMSELLTISTKELELWIVASVFISFIATAAINIFDGFRKARIR